VSIVRDRIQLHPVTWAFLPDTTIAHVRVSAFSQGAADDLKQALNEALQRKATGVILDLRNDPGGLLDEAVGAASQFLKNGNVLEEQDAQGHVTPVPVKPGGVALDVPMVVLINQGTASAAEIVAAALQDGHRAVLMGETTFGTGTVLNQFGLADHSALLLATEEWLTPSGHALWHHGVSPDVEVPLPSAASPLTPETERAMTLAQVEASNDAPLLRAMSSLERAVKS
jgi:carboxyl-terminal processing protease